MWTRRRRLDLSRRRVICQIDGADVSDSNPDDDEATAYYRQRR